MSMSIGLHTEDTGSVTVHAPIEANRRGWLQIQDSDRPNRSDVGIFAPSDPKRAAEFWADLAAKANELAVLVSAGL